MAKKEKKKQKQMTEHAGLVVIGHPRSHVSEQFRTIRTNIQFSMVDETIRSVVVTSADANAGKSTIAANLAATFASDEKRVLLVDADLRKPTLHKLFSLKNTEGLTTLLTDKTGKVEDAVIRTPKEGLYTITSGPIPPNPAELLSSNRMKEIEQAMLELFDLVVFDMPPILSVTDAQIMASRMDGTLFVIPKGEVNKDEVLKSKDLLEKVQANVIGAVLNKVDKNDQNYYYYGSE
ncbi:CpsD/CapB family tyrosine-protein kinase [Alkalibacterium psychrotolerans]